MQSVHEGTCHSKDVGLQHTLAKLCSTKQNQDEILRRLKVYSKGTFWSAVDMKEEVQYGLEARRTWQHFSWGGAGGTRFYLDGESKNGVMEKRILSSNGNPTSLVTCA